MGWLKDTVLAWKDAALDFAYRLTVGQKIEMLKAIKDLDALKVAYLALPAPMRALPEIAKVYEEQVRELEDPAKFSPFAPMARSLYEGFGNLKDTIESQINTTLKDALKPGTPEIKKTFEGILDTLLDGTFDAMDPKKTKISTDMRTEMKSTMKPLLGLGLSFTVATTLAELIHPTKELGFGRISHFLYDTIGWKSLMNAYIDPIRLNLIAQPTKYSINMLTRPFIPRLADALEWYGRGHIDEAEMLVFLKKHGVEPGWEYRYQRMGTKPSSYFMLNAIAREGFWDVDDFRFWLSDAGYGAFHITEGLLTPYEKKYGLKPPRTTQIDFLLDAYKQMNIRSTVGDVRSIRRRLMAEGWITRDAFEKDLAVYKIKKEDVADVLNAIEMEQDVKDKKELAKAYEKKYMKGRVTDDDLKKALVALGMREDYVDVHVKRLFETKQKKLAVDEEEKTLTKAEVLRAYKDGQKLKAWALKQIDNMGYSLDDATLLVEHEELELKDDVGDEWIRAAETRALNTRITIKELKKVYVDQGKSKEWSEARADYVSARLEGKPE